MVRFCTYCSRGNNVPLVLLYSSTVNHVLFTAVGSQMSGFEPSLRCLLFFRFFPFFFWVIEWGNGCLSNVPFTAALRRAPDEWVRAVSSLVCAFSSALFSVLFLWVGEGGYYCCCSYSIFHSIPKIYLFLAFQVTKRVAYLFLPLLF